MDLDVWRGVALVLARSGEVWQVESGALDPRPRLVRWDRRPPAFAGDDGSPRAAHAIRGYDGGALLASDGGVLAVGSGEPVFHAAGSWSDAARLSRVGKALVAVCGPNAWLWSYTSASDKRGSPTAFWVIDTRDW